MGVRGWGDDALDARDAAGAVADRGDDAEERKAVRRSPRAAAAWRASAEVRRAAAPAPAGEAGHAGELLRRLLGHAERAQRLAAESFGEYRGALARHRGATASTAASLAPELPRRLLHPRCLGCLPVIPLAGGRDGALWHARLRTGPLALRWPLTPYGLTLPVAGAELRFYNAEAAFLARRWAACAQARRALAAASTPADVARVAVVCAERHRAGRLAPAFGRNSAAEEASLLDVLRARQQLPGQDAVLLSTKGAMLLCHASPLPGCWPPDTDALIGAGADDEGGADEFAAPGVPGDGAGNQLGRALMLLRDEVCGRHGLPPAWPQGLRADGWEAAVHDCRVLCDDTAASWLLPAATVSALRGRGLAPPAT